MKEGCRTLFNSLYPYFYLVPRLPFNLANSLMSFKNMYLFRIISWFQQKVDSDSLSYYNKLKCKIVKFQSSKFYDLVIRCGNPYILNNYFIIFDDILILLYFFAKIHFTYSKNYPFYCIVLWVLTNLQLNFFFWCCIFV